MTKNISYYKNIILVSCLLFMLNSKTVMAQTYSFISFNIKYDNTSDTVNNWNDRKQKMAQFIAYYNPAFLGIQEGLARQVNYLNDALENYTFIGVGRDDGATKGEYSAIFYNKMKFKALQSSTFWLSASPEKVSVGWDASMERVCTYGLFEDLSTNERIWVFNAHFDHIGPVARKESAALIITKIQEVNAAQLPVVLMGDFNAEPDDEPIQLFDDYLDDALAISAKPLYGPAGTFNGFSNKVINRRIDYFFTKGMRIWSYAHLDDKLNNNKHLSDHLPVLIKTEIIINAEH